MSAASGNAFELAGIYVGETTLADLFSRFSADALEDAPELNTPASIKRGIRRVSIDADAAKLEVLGGVVETLLVECVDDTVAVLHGFFGGEAVSSVRSALAERHGAAADDTWETALLQAYVTDEDGVGAFVICHKALTAELERRMEGV